MVGIESLAICLLLGVFLSYLIAFILVYLFSVRPMNKSLRMLYESFLQSYHDREIEEKEQQRKKMRKILRKLEDNEYDKIKGL